jgi:hypothetical protein
VHTAKTAAKSTTTRLGVPFRRAFVSFLGEFTGRYLRCRVYDALRNQPGEEDTQLAKRTHKRGAKHAKKARKSAKHEKMGMLKAIKRTHKRKSHRGRKRVSKR